MMYISTGTDTTLWSEVEIFYPVQSSLLPLTDTNQL